MKVFGRIILAMTALMAVQMTEVKAQIFEFGFPFGDYGRRGQQQVVEEPVTKPEYKGGIEALNKYLERHFKAPERTDNVEGYITVACILNEKGKVEETSILRGLTKPLNDEAVRVAKALKFKPAKRGKKKVKSRFDMTFPIRKGKVSFSTLKLNTVEV